MTALNVVVVVMFSILSGNLLIIFSTTVFIRNGLIFRLTTYRFTLMRIILALG